MSDDYIDALVGRCLQNYMRRKPKAFVQMDCVGEFSGDDSVTPADKDGDSLMGIETTEMMLAADVRALIDPKCPPKDAARMLRKIADWVEQTPADDPSSMYHSAREKQKRIDRATPRPTPVTFVSR